MTAMSAPRHPGRRPQGVPVPLFTGLEGFWPSRRAHAFDELCR